MVSNLGSNVTSVVTDKLGRRISGKKTGRAGRAFNLFISNKNMDNFIKIIESLENSGQLINNETETIKHKIKSQELGFLGAIMASLAASLIASVGSSLIKSYNWKRSQDSRKKERKLIPFITSTTNVKSYSWNESDG